MTAKEVKQYLIDKEIYNDVDAPLISEMLFTLKILSDAKKDIRNRGNLVPINNDGTLFNQNPSIAIYKQALKSYLDICRKLSLSPYDRKALKLDVVEGKDDGW